MPITSKTLVFFSLLVILLTVPLLVTLAQNPPLQTTGGLRNLEQNLQKVGEEAGYVPMGPQLPAEQKFINTLSAIITYALSFLGVIAVLIVIYAGFKWMTAGGNEEQVNKAKKLLINGVIGLAIIILAYSITFFVIKVITDNLS